MSSTTEFKEGDRVVNRTDSLAEMKILTVHTTCFPGISSASWVWGTYENGENGLIPRNCVVTVEEYIATRRTQIQADLVELDRIARGEASRK